MSKVVIAVGYLVLILGRQTMDNASVVRLMKAGFSEDVIICAINRSLGGFDASVDGLIALKNAGVTNQEILAIVAKTYPSAAPLAEGPPADGTGGPVPAQ